MKVTRQLNIVDAPVEDIFAVMDNLREADRKEAYATVWEESPQHLTLLAKQHWGDFGWLFYYDNTPTCVVGATQLWPGMWSAWMLGTPDFPKIGTHVTKFISRDMRDMLKARNAVRLEARSHIEHHDAHRWLELLGAEKEAVLQRYGKNGEDFVIYRWDK